MKLHKINEAYPGSSTGGARTMPKKAAIDDQDLSDNKVYDDCGSSVDDLEDSDIVKPILKEPDDWLKPRDQKPRGPGA